MGSGKAHRSRTAEQRCGCKPCALVCGVAMSSWLCCWSDAKVASLWGPPCSTAAPGQPVHAAWLAVPAGVPRSRATHPGLAVSSFVSRLLGQREGEGFSVLTPRAEGFHATLYLQMRGEGCRYHRECLPATYEQMVPSGKAKPQTVLDCYWGMTRLSKAAAS